MNFHLTHLPPGISELTALTLLDLGYAGSLKSPQPLERLTQLRDLRLGAPHSERSRDDDIWTAAGQRLPALACLSALTSLTAFELCYIVKLVHIGPDSVMSAADVRPMCSCISLQRLVLHECRICQLPVEMTQLQQLRELDVSGVTQIQPSILLQLQRLQHVTSWPCKGSKLWRAAGIKVHLPHPTGRWRHPPWLQVLDDNVDSSWWFQDVYA